MGFCMSDENLINVARKELAEETGLTDYIMPSKDVFDLDIHHIPERKGVPAHEHYDVRFVFRASPASTITKNHESNALKWVKLEDVPKEPSLQRMIAKSRLNE